MPIANQPTMHVFGPGEETGAPGGNPQGTGRTCKLHTHTWRRRESNPQPWRCEANVLTTKPPCPREVSSHVEIPSVCLVPFPDCSLPAYGSGGPPPQNTSPTMDPAELREIIMWQGAILHSYQDQVEALQSQLRSASIAAPRDPPAAC
ncbi:hypothetical protein QTP86_029845, partial [Hemibagrus guttatus]